MTKENISTQEVYNRLPSHFMAAIEFDKTYFPIPIVESVDDLF